MRAAKHPNLPIPIALALLACLAFAASAVASEGPDAVSPSVIAGPEASGPYVALGDSIGAGAGAGPPPGAGYVYLLYDEYASSLGATSLLNRSQSGATSTSLISGGQLDTALADIDAASDTKAVTIDIGGNDYLNGTCRGDWDDPSGCPFRANLATALGALKQALGNDPGDEPFTVMAYYNPGAGTASAGVYDADLLGANGRIDCTDSGADVGLNDVILQEAATLGIAVADPYPAFEAAGQSLMSGDGIHPNAAGHQAIAEAFGEAVVPEPCDQLPPTISELIEMVEALGLPSGIERSLVGKLEQAQSNLTRANPNGACGKLGAFINEVEAQTGKKIDSAEAESLIADARLIRDSEVCS